MSPAFERGDVLFLTMYDTPIIPGDICVFKIEGRDIPIVHRVIKVHEEYFLIYEMCSGRGDIKILTKGDNNDSHDRGLYNRGQKWLERKDIVGRVRGYFIIVTWCRYFPYFGMVTILLNDYPQLKKALFVAIGFFVIFNRE